MSASSPYGIRGQSVSGTVNTPNGNIGHSSRMKFVGLECINMWYENTHGILKPSVNTSI